jgi:hypothetical protein
VVNNRDFPHKHLQKECDTIKYIPETQVETANASTGITNMKNKYILVAICNYHVN